MKKGEITTNALVVLFLVILVLFLATMFLLKTNLYLIIKNILPDFKNKSGDLLGGDEISICPSNYALIGYTYKIEGKEGKTIVQIKGKSTPNLILDYKDAEVLLFDKKIGSIINFNQNERRIRIRSLEEASEVIPSKENNKKDYLEAIYLLNDSIIKGSLIKATLCQREEKIKNNKEIVDKLVWKEGIPEELNLLKETKKRILFKDNLVYLNLSPYVKIFREGGTNSELKEITFSLEKNKENQMIEAYAHYEYNTNYLKEKLPKNEDTLILLIDEYNNVYLKKKGFIKKESSTTKVAKLEKEAIEKHESIEIISSLESSNRERYIKVKILIELFFLGERGFEFRYPEQEKETIFYLTKEGKKVSSILDNEEIVLLPIKLNYKDIVEELEKTL